MNFLTAYFSLNFKKGQALLITVVFFVFISLAMAFGVTSPAVKESVISRDLISSKKSYFLAEAGEEDVLYRIMRGKNYSSTEILSLDGFAATTTVVSSEGGSRLDVVADASIVGKVRKLRSVLVEDVGTVFNYASQVGDLGVDMSSNAEIKGNVFSNGNIVGASNSKIEGDALAVGAISSPSPIVTGTKTAGVDPVGLPSLDIDYWKARANINNNPINGDAEYNSGSQTLGPRQINGSLRLNNSAALTIAGPLYITGNLEMNNNTDMYLSGAFGSDGTVIVVDGLITFNSNSEVHSTSASPKGYIIFAGLHSGSGAIVLNSNAEIKAVVYALNGWVDINSNGEVVSLSGQGVRLGSNAELKYDLGLRDRRLTGGPSGGWLINSWRETE
ncbi:MAG: hypothetical protein AAB378_02910 [Patescibacteria group bacterium]